MYVSVSITTGNNIVLHPNNHKAISKLKAKLLSFGRVGLFITLFSMALAYFFLKIIGTSLIPTYIVLYLSMIGLSYYLNSRFTFKSSSTKKSIVLYYLSYGITMVLGIILLTIFERTLPFENWILAYMVIPFTALSNFFLSNQIFSKNVK